MARILVIDDEQSVRAALEQALRSAGHTVILAADGLEGITEHCRKAADLVITDIYMPGQDGVETMIHFRELAPEVPIIAISGNPTAEKFAVVENLGALALVEKPFDVKQLLELIENVLKRA